MKTSELTGLGLAWATAIAYVDRNYMPAIGVNNRIMVASAQLGLQASGWVWFDPENDSKFILQIVRQERIQLTPLPNGWAADYVNRGRYGDEEHSLYRQRGSTLERAVLRCYIRCRLGEEVEIPEELK